VIFNSLYEDPPQGFGKAIDHANRYLLEQRDAPSARVLAYLVSQLRTGSNMLTSVSAKRRRRSCPRSGTKLSMQLAGLFKSTRASSSS
jgi:hypothetical protein